MVWQRTLEHIEQDIKVARGRTMMTESTITNERYVYIDVDEGCQ